MASFLSVDMAEAYLGFYESLGETYLFHHPEQRKLLARLATTCRARRTRKLNKTVAQSIESMVEEQSTVVVQTCTKQHFVETASMFVRCRLHLGHKGACKF